MRTWTPIIAAAVALCACGGDDGAPAGNGGVGGGGGGATTTSGSGTGTGGPTAPASHVASFLPATEPGEGPGMVLLDNDTNVILTMFLGGAYFFQYAPEDPVEPQVAVSNDILTDAKVGFCEKKDPTVPCIYVSITGLTGPNFVQPGNLHTLRVSGDTVDTLVIEVTDQGPAPPFVAVRGWLWGFTAGQTSLWLEPGDAELNLALAAPSQYYLLGEPPMSLESLRLEASHGSYTGALGLPPEGAPGYTIAIGLESHPDSVLDVTLDAK